MKKYNTHMKPPAAQHGYILITALIFLAILTLVAVVSSQSTTFGYQMSTNLVIRDRAFQSSETARSVTARILDPHIFYGDWRNTVGVPTGFTVYDKDSAGGADNLSLGNVSGEDLLNDSTLVNDANFRLDSNSDGDFVDAGDVNATISVVTVDAVLAKGAGTAMSSGYVGYGKGAGAGGSAKLFEIRSRGQSITGSQAQTASEYRYIPR